MIVAVTTQSLVIAAAGVVLLFALFSFGVWSVRRQRELYPPDRQPLSAPDEDEERRLREHSAIL